MRLEAEIGMRVGPAVVSAAFPMFLWINFSYGATFNGFFNPDFVRGQEKPYLCCFTYFNVVLTRVSARFLPSETRQ